MKLGINLYLWTDHMHNGLLSVLESRATRRPGARRRKRAGPAERREPAAGLERARGA